MIRVLLADDHPVVRQGVAAVLAGAGDIEVVGQVGSAEEAIEEVDRLGPDVVLIDVRLPGIDGIEACALMRDSHPEVAVAVLTRFAQESAMLSAFDAGASGFLVKQTEPETFRQAVRLVAAGERFVDPVLAGRLIDYVSDGRAAKGPHGLTIQEMRVLRLLPKGLTNQEIAEAMHISPNTVKKHVSKITHKLEVGNRTEASATAIKEGLA